MRGRTGVAIVGVVLALVSGIEILAHGPLYQTDYRVAGSFWPITWTPWTRLAHQLAEIGQPWIACLAVGMLATALSARRRQAGPLVMAGCGLAAVGATTWLLKELFPHPAILTRGPGSFPSGHTGVAVVAAGLITYLLLPQRPWRGSATLAVAALWGGTMAWGRVIIESHWLSDVIAGWGIGMAALAVAIMSADSPLGRRGWARSAPDGR